MRNQRFPGLCVLPEHFHFLCFFGGNLPEFARRIEFFQKAPETATPHQLESAGSSLSSFPGQHLAIFASNPTLARRAASKQKLLKQPPLTSWEAICLFSNFRCQRPPLLASNPPGLGERPGFNFISWPAQVGIAHCIVATEQTGSTCLLSSVGRACAS